MTPIRAIRQKCVDCCAGQSKEIRLCPIKKCPLYPYRMGHRPKAEDLPAEESNGEKTAERTAIFEAEAIL